MTNIENDDEDLLTWAQAHINDPYTRLLRYRQDIDGHREYAKTITDPRRRRRWFRRIKNMESMLAELTDELMPEMTADDDGGET